MRRISAGFAVAIALAFPAFAFAASSASEDTPVTISADNYSGFFFDWTDADGVTHTSCVTETATDPAHIVALLKEVYTNPQIPGYTLDVTADTAIDPKYNNEREEIKTVKYKKCPYDPFNIENSVDTPISGATALLVELKDSYSTSATIKTAADALSYVKAVTLIPNQMHIGEEAGSTNPGFLFNIEATVNKFFIIAKGSIRPVASLNPLFYDMYEEFSPANNGPVFGAYADMDNGKQFAVDHNCGTIIGQHHDIVMSPEGNNKDYSINLMFYLPDFRFYGETRYNTSRPEDQNTYEYYTFYSKDHQPFFFFNKIMAEIDSQILLEGSEAKVPVKWDSSYKEITRSNVPEEFYIYRVVNDIMESEPIPASQLTSRQADTQIRPDGSIVRAADKTVQIYVTEERADYSHEVKYIIKGRRDGSEFSFVESNIVSEIIPGLKSTENMNITINGTPESTFDIPTQKNHYRNVIDFTDKASALGNRLLDGHITVRNGNIPGTVFELLRYADNDDTPVTIATMEVTGVSPTTWSGGGANVYTYTITYANGSNPKTELSAEKFAATWAGATKNPTADYHMPIRAVDANKGVIARFIDEFEASTARGEHPESYTYRLVYKSATSLPSGFDASNVSSNSVQVLVPRSTLYVGYVPYTFDQIMADYTAETRLPINPIGVSVRISQNPTITGYEIYDTQRGNQLVANVLRTPSGSFVNYITADDGTMKRAGLLPAGFQGKVPFTLPYKADINDEFALKILYDNGNSYGNVFARVTDTPLPSITESSVSCTGGRADFIDGKYYPVWYYDTQINWESEKVHQVAPWREFEDERFSSYEVFGFRVWGRQEHDEEEKLYEEIYSPDHLQTYAANSANASNFALDSSLHFESYQASADRPINVNHIVRLYAAAPAELLSADDNVKGGYVISEVPASARVTDTGTVSGIEGIDTDADLSLPALYYDLNGRQISADSLTPGVYIRVRGSITDKIVIK